MILFSAITARHGLINPMDRLIYTGETHSVSSLSKTYQPIDKDLGRTIFFKIFLLCCTSKKVIFEPEHMYVLHREDRSVFDVGCPAK